MDHDDEESDRSPFPCAICGTNLDFPVYKVFDHPVVTSLALCFICHDSTTLSAPAKDVDNASGDGDCAVYVGGMKIVGNDSCSICFCDTTESDDTVLLCSQESCGREYCESCIKNNLGEVFVEMLKGIDDWTCLVCNPKQLEELMNRKDVIQSRSLYTTVQSMAFDGDEYACDGGEHPVDVLENAKRVLFLVENVDDEIHRTNEMLSADFMATMRQEMARELDNDESRIQEEIDLYLETYQRHTNILHEQMAELQDCSDACGVFDCADFLQKRSGIGQDWMQDKVSKDSIRFEDLKRPELKSNDNDGYAQIHVGSDPPEELQEACVEEMHDLIIRKYIPEEDLDYCLFPPFFTKGISSILLKALFYCSKSEREILVSKYAIPPEVYLVMKYAKRSSSFTYDIELSKSFPAMLVKALRESSESAEQDFLMKFYNVSDTEGVEDILDEAKFLEFNKESAVKRRRNHQSFVEVDEEDMKEWIDHEEDEYRRRERVFGNNKDLPSGAGQDNLRNLVRTVTDEDDEKYARSWRKATLNMTMMVCTLCGHSYVFATFIIMYYFLVHIG